MSDNGLTEYLKQRVETLKQRNEVLTKLKAFVIKEYPSVYEDFKGEKR